jgi:hypothetical protein
MKESSTIAVLRGMRLLMGTLISVSSWCAHSQQLDKATQEVYLKSLDDPEFIDAHSQTDVYLQESGSDIPIRLTNTPIEEKYPSISQDRKSLIFCQGGLYILEMKSNEYRQLVGSEYWCRESQWLSSGREISFIGDASAQGQFDKDRDVFVVDKSGGNLRNITNTRDIDEFGHDWSPDGQQLSFIESDSGKSGNCRVWVQSILDSGDRFVAAEFSTSVVKTAWGVDKKSLYCSLRESEFVYSLVYVELATGKIVRTPLSDIFYDEWDVSDAGEKFTHAKREAHEAVGIDVVFPESLTITGNSPRWGKDGKCVVFVRRELPENFASDVKQGKRPENYNMVVIRKDGTMQFRTDTFDTQSPIVTELPEGSKQDFSGQCKNLTRSEAAALLEQNKSLQESVRVEYFEWEEE